MSRPGTTINVSTPKATPRQVLRRASVDRAAQVFDAAVLAEWHIVVLLAVGDMQCLVAGPGAMSCAAAASNGMARTMSATSSLPMRVIASSLHWNRLGVELHRNSASAWVSSSSAAAVRARDACFPLSIHGAVASVQT